MWIEFIVGLTGLIGLWMQLQKKSDMIRHFASWPNIALQPYWLMALFGAGKYGLFVCGIGYAALWTWEFINSFLPCVRWLFAWWAVINWWARDEQTKRHNPT